MTTTSALQPRWLSVPVLLKAMELFEDGAEHWAKAAASAFDLLKDPACHEVPKPEWWNDEALKVLSARVVALAPDGFFACNMRAMVLTGSVLWEIPWNAGPRTAAEIKEAATWNHRAASVAGAPTDKRRYERYASDCDEFADPLLAEEEAKAAEARVAAEDEAAAALKVAEAKATAAAEELLAEEEKEKQQASTKAGNAKQSKGKKGKGKR